MNTTQAVVWTDHQSALILRFDEGPVQAHKVHAHRHDTRQHGSGVRSEHEFFAEVCAGLTTYGEVLVVGSHTAVADFRHYADKHQPTVALRIVGYEVVGAMSENELAALGRKFFAQRGLMTGRAPDDGIKPRSTP